jgi:branched-subunit amino acid aminotransferase/4-amino-4-deoxychorismate lyase
VIFKTAWHNGEVVPLDALAVDMPWEPWGERGKGVFTTTRSRLGAQALAFWPRHRRRLVDALVAVGLPGKQIPLPTEGQLVEWVETLGAGDVSLRINVMESATGNMEVWAVARPLPLTPVPTCLAFSGEPVASDRGLKLVAQRWRRRATDLAAAKGVWDVVEALPDGTVVDGSRSNILVRIADRWVVAWVEGSTLPGTVASALIDQDLAKPRRITRRDAESATEVVATNSVRGVVPIHGVEGREFKPGRATEELRLWVEAEAVRHAATES